jgi:hypothetical protein
MACTTCALRQFAGTGLAGWTRCTSGSRRSCCAACMQRNGHAREQRRVAPCDQVPTDLIGPSSLRMDDVDGDDSVIFVRRVISEPPVNFLMFHTTCLSFGLYSADWPAVAAANHSRGAGRHHIHRSTTRAQHTGATRSRLRSWPGGQVCCRRSELGRH